MNDDYLESIICYAQTFLNFNEPNNMQYYMK